MPIYYRHFFEVNFAHRNGDGLIEKDQIKITVLSSDTMIGPAFFLAGLRGGYKQGQRKAKADMMEAAKFFLENEKRRTDETN